MDFMIWLEQQDEKIVCIATLAVIFVILIVQLIAVALAARPKHKETHISGFTDRKAKKGEIKK
jgi:hypothetical protein